MQRSPHRASIVLVVLVDLAGVEQRHPCGELGLHIQDLLAGGKQLLSQQMPQAPSAFDRPAALGPPISPLQQPFELPDCGARTLT